jgi:hypothetical protein
MVTAETKKQKYTYSTARATEPRQHPGRHLHPTEGNPTDRGVSGECHPPCRRERERETVHLGRRLQEVHRKKQQTYQDKLNGVISEEFWRELHTRWTEEESVLAARLSRLMQPISAE